MFFDDVDPPIFSPKASKAIADAFNEASVQLRALSSELMSSMKRLSRDWLRETGSRRSRLLVSKLFFIAIGKI